MLDYTYSEIKLFFEVIMALLDLKKQLNDFITNNAELNGTFFADLEAAFRVADHEQKIAAIQWLNAAMQKEKVRGGFAVNAPMTPLTLLNLQNEAQNFQKKTFLLAIFKNSKNLGALIQCTLLTPLSGLSTNDYSELAKLRFYTNLKGIRLFNELLKTKIASQKASTKGTSKTLAYAILGKHEKTNLFSFSMFRSTKTQNSVKKLTQLFGQYAYKPIKNDQVSSEKGSFKETICNQLNEKIKVMSKETGCLITGYYNPKLTAQKIERLNNLLVDLNKINSKDANDPIVIRKTFIDWKEGDPNSSIHVKHVGSTGSNDDPTKRPMYVLKEHRRSANCFESEKNRKLPQTFIWLQNIELALDNAIEKQQEAKRSPTVS